ncbi:MAG: S1-like domain-containing RNA-binding protein [Lachnospiraceae bacterium]|nr:S1-like domain-containing RNA-binding protein [Lachnospiraceae bacterium]
MLKIGCIQNLEIVKMLDFGAYLAENAGESRENTVLLPAKQVPEGAEIGTRLDVFLYRDSEDRLIATTRKPVMEVGGVALLAVKETSRIGAFLDWGLEKDLLLPFHEQTARVKAGDQVLAALYVDKSGRLCATMKLYPYLRTDSPYLPGAVLEARVYEISENFGVFLAVEDTYSAMIPRQEAQGSYKPGQVIRVRVTKVREDGKLTVSAREKSYLQMDTDAEQIFRELEQAGGEFPFDDKASPEQIREKFGISKAAFKRAVGHLLKEGKIVLLDGCIRKADGD